MGIVITAIAYMGGVILSSIVLGKDLWNVVDKKERYKSIIISICTALFWPVLGMWILWEAFDIWRICQKNQIGKN